mgnify:CR=1 FL=1
MTLDDLPNHLDKMISNQKEKARKTFVAKYKGENIVCRSGKSSWPSIGAAKNAIINHFESLERLYSRYGYKYGLGEWNEVVKKEKDFRAKLWELIEFVQLT